MKLLRDARWLKALLVVLFVSYYVGGTAFTHTHHFLNYTITHSHPYLPGADGLPHHEHSVVAFNTIEELASLYMEQVLYLPMVMIWVLLSVIICLPGAEVILSSIRRCDLRAPPCLV